MQIRGFDRNTQNHIVWMVEAVSQNVSQGQQEQQQDYYGTDNKAFFLVTANCTLQT